MIIDLPRQIDPELAADLEKEAAFVSPFLRRLRVTGDARRGGARDRRRRQDAEVQGKVERFLEAMLKRTHRFETKVFLRNERRDDARYATGVHEELERRGWLFDYGRGHVALSGPVLALARLIDARAAALYAEHFNAAPGSFPAFVDAEILHRCGYFDSHPNAVSLVGHMTRTSTRSRPSARPTAAPRARCCRRPSTSICRACASIPPPASPATRRSRAGGSARKAPPSPGRAGCSATNCATSPASIACGSSTSASWCSSAARSTSPNAAGGSCR